MECNHCGEWIEEVNNKVGTCPHCSARQHQEALDGIHYFVPADERLPEYVWHKWDDEGDDCIVSIKADEWMTMEKYNEYIDGLESPANTTS